MKIMNPERLGEIVAKGIISIPWLALTFSFGLSMGLNWESVLIIMLSSRLAKYSITTFKRI